MGAGRSCTAGAGASGTGVGAGSVCTGDWRTCGSGACAGCGAGRCGSGCGSAVRGAGVAARAGAGAGWAPGRRSSRRPAAAAARSAAPWLGRSRRAPRRRRSAPRPDRSPAGWHSGPSRRASRPAGCPPDRCGCGSGPAGSRGACRPHPERAACRASGRTGRPRAPGRSGGVGQSKVTQGLRGAVTGLGHDRLLPRRPERPARFTASQHSGQRPARRNRATQREGTPRASHPAARPRGPDWAA